jgi:hypothetical protein
MICDVVKEVTDTPIMYPLCSTAQRKNRPTSRYSNLMFVTSSYVRETQKELLIDYETGGALMVAAMVSPTDSQKFDSFTSFATISSRLSRRRTIQPCSQFMMSPTRLRFLKQSYLREVANLD